MELIEEIIEFYLDDQIVGKTQLHEASDDNSRAELGRIACGVVPWNNFKIKTRVYNAELIKEFIRFEGLNTEINKMEKEVRDFGSAIKALKAGYKVAREGWNGKGMFLWLNLGSFDKSLETDEVKQSECYTIDGICKELFEVGNVGTVTRLPNINMRSANGSTVTSWLASQTDMLAEDWTIVE